MRKSLEILTRKSSENLPDYRELIPKYSDEELKGVLKRRGHYIPEAAEIAIDEAIKRGLIHSKQDLFAEEYRHKEHKTSWFPVSNNKETRRRIKRSISRSLVICGIIAVAYGLVQINDAKQLEGGVITLFGLVWLLASLQLNKVYKNIWVLVLFIQNLLAGGFIFYSLLQMKTLVFMDFFAAGVLFLLILYGLVYLYKSENAG